MVRLPGMARCYLYSTRLQAFVLFPGDGIRQSIWATDAIRHVAFHFRTGQFRCGALRGFLCAGRGDAALAFTVVGDANFTAELAVPECGVNQRGDYQYSEGEGDE